MNKYKCINYGEEIFLLLKDSLFFSIFLYSSLFLSGFFYIDFFKNLKELFIIAQDSKEKSMPYAIIEKRSIKKGNKVRKSDTEKETMMILERGIWVIPVVIQIIQ